MRKVGAGRSRDAMVFPFIGHQVIEYLGALYLLQVGAKTGGRPAAPCYLLGALMLVAAAFSGKPLGGGRITRPQHRFVDIPLIVAVAATPFVFGFSDDTASLIRLEGLAVALVVLMVFTSYAHPQPGVAKDIARGLKDQGPRMAGQFFGRRMARRRPPGGPGRT